MQKITDHVVPNTNGYIYKRNPYTEGSKNIMEGERTILRAIGTGLLL